MTFKQIVTYFVFLFFFTTFSFCNTEDLSEKNIFPIISLPVTLPEQMEKQIEKKLFSNTQKKSYNIKWVIDRQSGIQSISKVSNPEKFPTNNYKSTMLSVFVSDLFILHSDFLIGFINEKTNPFYFNNWISAETNLYIANKVFLTDGVYFYPFAGYIFSEYYLNKFTTLEQYSNVRFQSIKLGSQISYNPARIITLDYSMAFSPISKISNKQAAFFQLCYETAIRLHTNFLQFSTVLASKNNISYSPKMESFNVSEIGFRFKLTL